MNDRLPRKLAAILYADVAGYSRLTSVDEDSTHKTLSEYLNLFSRSIESHAGQVMHYAGDAILARFDAAVDALTCASAVQAEIARRNAAIADERQLRFRIGINLGDVIEDRGEIYGDGVNVAARLESLASPGGICVSDAVRSATQKKLDFSYQDLGDQSLKNIEEPVRAFRVVMNTGPSAASVSASKVPAAASLEIPLPDRPSIAIVPFVSLATDPNQDYLADGMRLGIQASLVQLPELFLVNVIALNAYRGKDISALAVGQELEVQYVLEGTLQQSGDRIRVTVQLTDVASRQAIWAERYDRVTDDIFKLQDEITWEVITSVCVRFQKSDVLRIWFAKLTDPMAREYYYRGMSHLYALNEDDNRIARNLFEQLHRVQPDAVIGSSNVAVTNGAK